MPYLAIAEKRRILSMEVNAMAKTILDILGTMLIVVGIAGFVSPALGGTHLSPVHNFLHIFSGGMALWFGLRSQVRNARLFSWIMAACYGLLAIAGFAFGRMGDGFASQPSDPRLLTVVPNVLEFGQSDHVLNLAVALVFLSAVAMARPSPPVETSERTA